MELTLPDYFERVGVGGGEVGDRINVRERLRQSGDAQTRRRIVRLEQSLESAREQLRITKDKLEMQRNISLAVGAVGIGAAIYFAMR